MDSQQRQLHKFYNSEKPYFLQSWNQRWSLRSRSSVKGLSPAFEQLSVHDRQQRSDKDGKKNFFWSFCQWVDKTKVSIPWGKIF